MQHLLWPGEIKVRKTNWNQTCCVLTAVGQKSALTTAHTLFCLQDKRQKPREKNASPHAIAVPHLFP